jgi:nucleoside-diphosphate-sugar epimerase
VQFIEEYTNRKAKIKYELKTNEVKKTFADTMKIDKLLAQESYISFDDGMKSFLDWFKNWKS